MSKPDVTFSDLDPASRARLEAVYAADLESLTGKLATADHCLDRGGGKPRPMRPNEYAACMRQRASVAERLEALRLSGVTVDIETELPRLRRDNEKLRRANEELTTRVEQLEAALTARR